MSTSERRAEPEGASGGGLRRQAVFRLVDHAAFATLGLALQCSSSAPSASRTTACSRASSRRLFSVTSCKAHL